MQSKSDLLVLSKSGYPIDCQQLVYSCFPIWSLMNGLIFNRTFYSLYKKNYNQFIQCLTGIMLITQNAYDRCLGSSVISKIKLCWDYNSEIAICRIEKAKPIIQSGAIAFSFHYNLLRLLDNDFVVIFLVSFYRCSPTLIILISPH